VNVRTYSIGEFARLGGVTAKALRYYDRMGVLCPAIVDSRTRYRRYVAEQLAELYEVMSLTRLGLSLRQVRAAMDDGRSMANTLRSAGREIAARIADDQARLAWIESKLTELSGSPAPAVVVKREPARTVLSMRERLATYADADGLLEDLARDVPRGSGTLRGTVWHDCGERSGVIDCEAVLSSEPVGRSRRARELPATTLACVIHRGSDESSRRTYQRARDWIAVHGYAVVGPNREWYLDGPERSDADGDPVPHRASLGSRTVQLKPRRARASSASCETSTASTVGSTPWNDTESVESGSEQAVSAAHAMASVSLPREGSLDFTTTRFSSGT
jgi:DNA-binding transcriptional MerR regulator